MKITKTLSACQAKTHLPALLERVAKGERITITKHGVPVAMLVPVASSQEKNPRQLLEEIRRPAERIHVIPSEGNWAVMKEGSNRATRIYTRKQQAVDRARSIGKDGMIVVHHKDGTIESIHHAG